MNQESSKKSERAKKEEEILAFWKRENIFEKTLAKKSQAGEFVLYDGPPFATGLPHYGHILAGILKDVIPRYKTMRGFHVRRRWGWDCHGLPLENLVEKELNLTTKKDIENYGVGRFNKVAEESVLRYADEWRKIIPRTGRWVDMERDYRTMDASYTESVWWVFKTLYDKGLIYEGFKPMHLCPRCETTLSNFEVSQGYAEITDLAVTVKLPLVDEKDTFLLAWTTTPWTLPGNMAVAINKEIIYGKFSISNFQFPNKQYVVAKSRAKEIFGDQEYKLVEEFKGEKLVGERYEPPFDYYKDAGLPHKENAWKVYAAPFVSTEEGTGVVHIAPAFGEDDLRLAEENKIPVVHHVGTDGKFKTEVRDFAGLSVKPKGDHQSADREIIKYLTDKNLLFKEEKITHSYPLCWRCETPLLNYAANSWFVSVTKIKDKLVAANKKIRWIPEDIRDGRFGNWLRDARDWAISRSRYWGAPIPVWRNKKTGKTVVIGSMKELQKRTKKSGNTYFLMRHGEAESNVSGIVSSALGTNHLTEKGHIQARAAAEKFKGGKIDLIISSPLSRAKETAEIFAEAIGFEKTKILFDAHLRETGFGSFEGKQESEYQQEFPLEKRFNDAPGETIIDSKKRMTSFLYDIDEKYKNKTILLVSHSDPLWTLYSGASGLNRKEMFSINTSEYDFMENAEIRKLSFVSLPHNDEFELDLHRPEIDELKVLDDDGEILERVPEVFDCWFESGAMPYGESHYPFENTKEFNPLEQKGFPADFIAEGLDQTRGWFYSLLVLSVALFGKTAYENVIVNGLILAEDGKKMSKRLKNYPDPVAVMDTYGADALRFYLLSSPAMRAEDLNFSEKGIKEIQGKIVSRAENVLSFLEMYTPDIPDTRYSILDTRSHILDRWIRIRLEELVRETSLHMENYELDKATRSLALFIDDLSTWYLRRSRERLKSENEEERRMAAETLQFVLLELSKIMAPFTPLIAEDIYRRAGGVEESVHLEEWPQGASGAWFGISSFFLRLFGGGGERALLSDMGKVRAIVSRALEARAKKVIKVRQPLASLKIRNPKSEIRNNEELLQLIKDEVNVKEVVFGADIETDVELDTEITPELKKEGQFRELVRAVQELRKNENLMPRDIAMLSLETDEKGRAFVKEHEQLLKKAATLDTVDFKDGIEGTEIKIDDLSFVLSLVAKS